MSVKASNRDHRKSVGGLCLVFTVLFLPKVEARLGMTVEECRERYGPEVELNLEEKFARFEKAGWLILTNFEKGKVTEISFAHADADGKRANISDKELKALLSANSGGAVWEGPKKEGLSTFVWKSKDGKMVAKEEKIAGVLTFTFSE